jgi:hypothetical protein
MANFKVIEESGKRGFAYTIGMDVDGLFALPLGEFVQARNALSAELKKAGRREDAEHVKTLTKPSVTAWAVNQLYWKHRETFDRLIASGRRFLEAQAAQLAGKSTDLGEARDTRQKVITELLRQAADVLRDAGHNASPDTMRRIGANLEALSAYGTLPDAASPGRLTADVDPPGFDVLATLMPNIKVREAKPVMRVGDADEAKVLLYEAERELNEARSRAQTAEIALRRATVEAKQAEQAVADATLKVEKLSQRLESIRSSGK